MKIPRPKIENLMPKSNSPNPDPQPDRSTKETKEVRATHLASSLAIELSKVLSPPETQEELGRIAGYRILRLLGRGGMGIVLLAEDLQLGRKVALKLLKPELATLPSARDRFFREARAMASVKHDHICMIHQVGEDRGVVFLSMEYLEGEDLDDVVGREHLLPLQEVIRIVREITLGLSCLHQNGIIHRDIKPANIWIEKYSGRVKLMDFGLARGGSLGAAGLTQEGTLIGTPAFMAPEQVESETIDHRADLFSLGCVLYFLLTEKTPFAGDTSVDILYSLLHQEPEAIEEVRSGLPRRLVQLVNRLLSKDPSKRPEDSYAVLDALYRIEQDSPMTETIQNVHTAPTIESKTQGHSTLQAKKPSSWVLIWSIGAGVICVGLFILILIWGRGNHEGEQKDPNKNAIVQNENGTSTKTNKEIEPKENRLLNDPLSKEAKGSDTLLGKEMKQPLTLKDWGKVFDPLNDCKIEADDQKLTITIPGKLHDFQLALPLNAPRVLQEIEGDFLYVVTIDPVPMPPKEVIKPALTPYHSAGILLYQDAKTYLRFERAVAWGNERFNKMIRMEAVQAGKPLSSWAFEDNQAGPVHFYLEREGNRIKFFFSTDRKKGFPFNPVEIRLDAKLQIGVLGINTTPNELKIRFSDPILTSKTK
jgi:serine/threonine protein kinase